MVLPEVPHPTLLDGSDPLMVRPRYEYTYDAQGNQVTIRDNVYQIGSDLATAEVFYDHGGTAGDFSEDYDTRVTQFAYDAQGHQLTRTLPEDQEEEKQYDSQGRLALEVSFEGVVTAYVYADTAGSAARLL